MIVDHVNPKIFDDDVEQVPTRNGFGEGLLEAGKENSAVVALCADLTESTRTHLFAEEFPERFVQQGIAEQSMASVASGMAAMGKVPFIASYAMFSPGRSWEQVRTTIAYNDANVKVIGAHAGVSVGPDGATHQAIEDIALMRVIPNMVVIAPMDVHEARKATMAAAAYVGPVYIRLGREKTPVVSTVGSPFEIGKAELLYARDETHAKRVGIISTGTLTQNALVAAQKLEAEEIGVSVLHVATIKPLDTEAVEALAADHDVLLTVEEHQISGGLGGAVTEHMSEVLPIRIGRIGVRDQFGQSGTPDELIAHYGMDAESIVVKAKEILE